MTVVCCRTSNLGTLPGQLAWLFWCTFYSTFLLYDSTKTLAQGERVESMSLDIETFYGKQHHHFLKRRYFVQLMRHKTLSWWMLGRMLELNFKTNEQRNVIFIIRHELLPHNPFVSYLTDIYCFLFCDNEKNVIENFPNLSYTHILQFCPAD